MISEVYLSPIGIIFLTQLTEIDQGEGMDELIAIREKGIYYNFILRYLIGLFFIGLIIVWFLGYLNTVRAGFKVMELFIATFITSLFLGTLGITIANVTKNYIAGYLVAFTYFLFELMTGGDYTGKLFLFSLSRGQFEPKYYLLGISILLLGTNLIYLKYKNVD
jgi:hypothetical protein